MYDRIPEGPEYIRNVGLTDICRCFTIRQMLLVDRIREPEQAEWWHAKPPIFANE